MLDRRFNYTQNINFSHSYNVTAHTRPEGGSGRRSGGFVTPLGIPETKKGGLYYNVKLYFAVSHLVYKSCIKRTNLA